MKARFFALAALVLGMVSCQQDFDAAPQVGGEVDFQLSVGAGEISATRATDGDTQEGYDSAYGAIDYLNEADWAKYDLRYSLEVYDKADSYENATPIKDRMVQIVDKYEPVMFDLRLVPNRDYHFVVFADFVPQGASSEANTKVQSELGLRHNIGDNLGQITIKNDAINDEIADAYFATKDIKIENSDGQDILFKRPYGQVGVIATDLAELNLNVDPAYVKVFYTAKHPQKFNAVTGAIDAYDQNVEYEFQSNYAEGVSKNSLANHYYTADYDAKKDKNANGVERHTHMTLFTDYILATDEQESIHFTMQVYDKGGLIKETHFNTDIPVQRNNLTTIVGNVLTTATEINVTIDDNFATNYTLTMWDGKSVKPVAENNGVYEIYEAAELAWFAKQVNEGNKFSGKIVKLCKDIHLNGERWTPIGATGKFEGTFDGQDNVIEGLFVKVTDKTPAGLFANAKYVKNLKVCHAEVTGHYKSAVIVGDGLCSRISNCHVENATVVVTPLNEDDGNHVGAIVGYLSAENEAYVKNCSVKNAEIRGYRDVAAIAGTATTKSTTPEVTGNTVENVTVIADQTVAYKEVKVANVDAVVGRRHANAVVENNEVENADVYVKVNTAANLDFQANNSPANRDIKIVLADDIEGDVTVAQKPDVKISIDGRGYNYAGVITVDGKSATYTTAGLTIKNLNFNAETISADACIRLGDGNNATRYTCNVTVKGCTFDVPGAVGVKSYTGGDKKLTISNCTATAKAHSLLQAKGIDGIRVEGCTVKSKNGLNFNNSNNVVVDSSNVDVQGYAVRFGEGSSDTTGAAESYLIENSTLKSACADEGDAVIVLRGTAAKATLNLINTTINGKPQFINNTDAKVYVDGAIVVSNADEIAAALTADKANVGVVLANDIDLPISKLGQQTGGSGEYKLGGEQTENITIDLNGYKLNITTTYWSGIGAKNADALFTIKNGTMTSSQPTGTWNSYDLTFANCNYVIEDVVFEKAIAFAATGKSASLKNVTINETHDYYAMWISAEGQNVAIDGLTINSAGRGIKIDEQYVDALAKVTLTVKNSKFTTAKKAAIMVKSAAGAEINVENLDITGVVADTTNAVWVDEDAATYFDLVTVNGASKKQE